MDKPPDNRKDTRFKTRFDALFASGQVEGAGVLTDLSYSGARVEEASMCPPTGTRVRLYVFIQPISPFELVGHVVRSSESEFAIAYEVSDPELRALVDDITAIVGTNS